MKKYLIAFILFLFSIKGYSTHIVGGEIYYDCLGGNNYRITLKLYRDCINGVAPYDNPASIGVFNSAGALIKNLLVSFPGSTPVTNNLNPCLIPPTNICVEQAIYDTIVNLPAIAGGYDLTYQRCCRNNTILNLVNPQDVGATYTCHIPDAALAATNSSPRFNNFPPIFLCANNPVNFDHSATDPDGDLLVYEFANPYDGASSLNPMPQPPSAPNYPLVNFLPPYSATYPMSSSPAMAVNPVTGLLTGTPNIIGQWVVGVRVKEYRNGQLLSINMRDFQFNVVTCPPSPVSSVPAQTSFCNGMTVNFQNNSVNGTTYHWDFGDTLIKNDTSNVKTPTWSYAQSGLYNVMLIVNPGTPCADTAYTTFLVFPLLNPNFLAGAPQCFTGNNFSFAAAGAFSGNGTFSWSFGPNASPATSSSKNVSNVSFNAPGTYPVTLTVSENGCNMSFVDTVIVLPEPKLAYNPPPVTGCVPLTVQFSDSSFSDPSITSIIWNFGDGSTSMQNDPNHTYTVPGIYNVSVSIATNNMCIGSMTFQVPGMVTVHPSPVAGLTANPLTVSIFDSLVTFTDQSLGATSCWIYFGDGDSSNNCGGTHLYPSSGDYTVTQIVQNEYGCRDQYELHINADMNAIFWIPNAFTPNHDGKNELFMPVAMGIQNFQMTIFDRWGNKIFETNDLEHGWDGAIKGTRCQEDVYVWKVEFESAGENHEEHSMVGHVTLVH
jgi:gliding motility-associated-like protein